MFKDALRRINRIALVAMCLLALAAVLCAVVLDKSVVQLDEAISRLTPWLFGSGGVFLVTMFIGWLQDKGSVRTRWRFGLLIFCIVDVLVVGLDAAFGLLRHLMSPSSYAVFSALLPGLGFILIAIAVLLSMREKHAARGNGTRNSSQNP